MKKKLMTMLFAICFMVWFLPVDVFAAESITWEHIIGEIDEGNLRETGWYYEGSESPGKIVIEFGTTVEGTSSVGYKIENNGTIIKGNFQETVINRGTISEGTFAGLVENYKTIENGTFTNYVNNKSDGVIEDGIFNCSVWNVGKIKRGTFTGQIQANIGTISGGTYSGNVINYAGGIIEGGNFVSDDPYLDFELTNNGTIAGGQFDGAVRNTGTIETGAFYNEVQNDSNGTIEGGTFSGKVTNLGKIIDGRFRGELENTNSGIISGGKFSCSKPNTGTVTDDFNGEFNYVDPSQSPSEGSSSSHDKDVKFLEPVIIVVPEGQKYMDNVIEQLSVVPTDGHVVIDTKDWYCFNRTLAEKVSNMKDVIVTIKYLYQGKKYEVTIPAGSDIVSLLDENGFVGFRYLDAVFGGKEITE